MRAVPLMTRMLRRLAYNKTKWNRCIDLHFSARSSFLTVTGNESRSRNSLSHTHVQDQRLTLQNFVRNISFSEKRAKETLSAADMKKAMEQLTEQFMEARELIADARESMETVYFSEDMAEAQEAVSSTLAQYKKLLDQLSENQRQDVLRTIGLRMEELKAQEQALKDALHDSH